MHASEGRRCSNWTGRAIQPTPDGFLAALEDKTGGALANPAEAASRLGRLTGRVVIIVDTYELLRMLDPWLRQSFVPALSDKVRIVLSGREPPMTGWPADLGGLFGGIEVENLSRADAEALLAREGVDPSAAERVYRLARGHPLSLRLASVALSGGSEVGLDALTVKAIVEGLTELYLGVLDPKTREARDAASVIRRPTLSLLGAMLPDTARRTRLLGSARSRSSSSATTASASMTPSGRPWPRFFDPRIPRARAATEPPRGASCAPR
jgi:hypothetical protein